MPGPDGGPTARQASSDLHQTRHVDCGDDVGARLHDGVELVVENRTRRLGVLDRERATEPAALGRARKRNQIEALDGPQEVERRVAEPQSPQRVARRVVRDPVRKGRADVGHAEMPHEKLGQLQHPGCEGAHRPRELRVLHLLGEVGVEVAHHRHARSRRCDDDLGVGEDAHESMRESRGGVLIPGVEVELPATRLFVGELDVVTEPLEDAHCRDPRFGEERVVETRDEERDAQGAA